MAAKGVGSVLESSEDQNKTRRAAKARRQRQRSSKGPSSSHLFADIKQDRRESREAAAQQRREKQEELREKQRFDRRVQQALIAADYPAFLALEPGSPAKVIATGILLNFPTISPAEGQSRTRTALAEAKKALTPEQLRRHRAIAKGYTVANAALEAAYRQVGRPKVPQPRSA